MKIAIVGWGIEGQSAYRYFGPEHEYLIVNEQPCGDFPPESPSVKVNFLAGGKTTGMTGTVRDLSYLDGIEVCDKIIYSVASAKNLERRFGKDESGFWQKASTIQHIFFELCASKNIIGVTGTKGKGTTSTLLAKILEASGKKVFLGGNIGLGVLDFVDDVEPGDWVVLELSSFQLYRLSYSPKIALCLMVVPEHLDWHDDFEDYLNSKANIFKYQSTDDLAIYFSENEASEKIAKLSAGKKIPYYSTPGARLREDGMLVIGADENLQELVHKDQVKLLGEHNLQNICAAATAFWQIEQNAEAVRIVAGSFAGLEHRIEFVRELDGVSYYNDSFATTPETTIACLKAFEEKPKIIILGGSDKGIPFDKLADEVAMANVKQAILIGDTGPVIGKLLKGKGFNNIQFGFHDMPAIVNTARQFASPGDVVLLSTACASFGMFKDYKDRGNQFKNAVKLLS